ncbi:hypothetical protein [Tenacibaculum jejuense]|uniref:Uncharacterized protein n=1 Tax=Tenacibaculum jejuense TaxID=584609 RepID=A0A238UBP6_9FLAO|nr:hypothetical protein [Tenacibaculum jejuense]SNR15998.1 protein of unknown function [Tenacibaculum jejuense]
MKKIEQKFHRKTCYLCNAYVTTNGKCTKCSGEYRKSKPKCIIDEKKVSTTDDINNFIRKSVNIFFEQDNYKTEILGANIVKELLHMLKVSDDTIEYNILIALRLCGVEIWARNNLNHRYEFRLPGEDNFQTLIDLDANKVVELESFKEGDKLDSSYLSCFPEILNSLSIRVFLNKEDFEYRFYNVVDYIQKNTSEYRIGFYENVNSNIFKKVNYDDCRFLTKEEKQNLKHYTFNIDNVSFSIIAEGFVKEKGFHEIYREDDKKLNLLK